MTETTDAQTAEPSPQTFKIRVRQYADNSTWSMSHHDLETYANTIDDIVADVDDGTPYREFDVEITSRPPSWPSAPVVSVTAPDAAPEPADAISATVAA